MEFPLPEQDKRIIEQAVFDVLQALIFKGGLPIFTVARTDTPKQGEIWLSDISGTRKINAYISGHTYSATLS